MNQNTLFSERIIGDYKILLNKEIGSGKFGRVFECLSQSPQDQGIPLCAKVLTFFDPKAAEVEEKILNILISKAKFNANIVGVKKVINLSSEKQMVIIMERCQENLQQEMERKRYYSPEETKDVLKQILAGYAPLADEKIIHRDIKPENILIAYLQGKPIYKLADFGVGKIIKNNEFNITSQGTPSYAAPEINQLVSDERLKQDFKSIQGGKSIVDMYSIGIILHQLLLGVLPFKPSMLDVANFFKTLKTQVYQIQPYQNCDILLLKTIEGLIQYYPSQRITYEKLCQQYLPQVRSFIKPKIQSATIDPYLKEFKDLMQNYIDMQTQIGQTNQVVQLMQQAINTIYDKVAFKQVILQLRQFFKFDKTKFYSEYLIRFFFALKFYTNEWSQSYYPQTMTLSQMREYLQQYGL